MAPFPDGKIVFVEPPVWYGNSGHEFENGFAAVAEIDESKKNSAIRNGPDVILDLTFALSNINDFLPTCIDKCQQAVRIPYGLGAFTFASTTTKVRIIFRIRIVWPNK
jgi:hypothetical protein